MQRPVAPFVFFARRVAAREGAELWNGPAQRLAYSLWSIRQGTVTAAGGTTRVHLRPAQSGITEPGTPVLLSAGAEGILVVFDIFWRHRRIGRGRGYVVDNRAAPQPPWASVWGCAAPFPLDEDWGQSAGRLADHIHRHYWQGEAAHLECNTRLGHWLARWHHARSGGGESVPARIDNLAVRADELIERIYDRRAGVAAIAHELRVTPEALSRAYVAYYGYSPRRAIEERRLTHAERLLGNSGLSIGRIAARVGYRSHTVFIRAFRRAHGITPTAWRRDQLRR